MVGSLDLICPVRAALRGLPALGGRIAVSSDLPMKAARVASSFWDSGTLGSMLLSRPPLVLGLPPLVLGLPPLVLGLVTDFCPRIPGPGMVAYGDCMLRAMEDCRPRLPVRLREACRPNDGARGTELAPGLGDMDAAKKLSAMPFPRVISRGLSDAIISLRSFAELLLDVRHLYETPSRTLEEQNIFLTSSCTMTGLRDNYIINYPCGRKEMLREEGAAVTNAVHKYTGA